MSAPITLSRENSCLWVTLRSTEGELIASPQAEALRTELEKEETRQVVVDLSPLPYFGSTVLDFLVVLWRKVSKRNGQLVIYRPSPIGREVLAAARLDQLWPLTDSRDDALRLAAI